MTLEQREQAAKLLTEFYHNASFWVNDDGYIYGYWGATMGPVGEGMVVLSDSDAEQRLRDSIKRQGADFEDKQTRWKSLRSDILRTEHDALRARLQREFWLALKELPPKGLDNGRRSKKDDSSIT